jgi:hypothetical protein
MQCGYADLPVCGGELSVGCGEVGAVCVVGVGRSVVDGIVGSPQIANPL